MSDLAKIPLIVGSVTDEAGGRLEVYVVPGAVILSIHGLQVRLSDVLAEDFAQLFTSACWQAGAHGGDA